MTPEERGECVDRCLTVSDALCVEPEFFFSCVFFFLLLQIVVASCA
jgi:hypothetical protein